jgi:RNA polymerase sigma-70 factor (ECF subfamily)
VTAQAQLNPQVLVEHRSFVLALARSLTRDEASAEDLAQDALVEALARPPATGSLRGWFATVLRTRAIDRGRVERRRAAREQRAARPEALAPEPSGAERVELAQRVVAAVLALDEPYRSVVIGVYYEGLTPARYAERSGLSANTVRSQLSRALEQLRAKFDREHGERRVWSSGLVALLEHEELGVAKSAAAAWVPWAAVLVAAGASVLVWRASLPAQSEAPADGAVGVLAFDAGGARTAPTLDAQDSNEGATRAPVADSPARLDAREQRKEIDAVLERMRQVKIVLLERLLRVAPEHLEQFAAFAAGPRSGVVRLLERDRFRELELPWMREAGSFYSFTEGVHDFNRRPQIVFEGGHLRSASDGGVLHLGYGPMETVEHRTPLDGDLAAQLACRALWSDPTPDAASSWRVSHELQRLADETRERGELDLTSATELARGARSTAVRPQVGANLLLRCRRVEEVDVLVALHVVQVDDDSCTLAWRELKRWPVADEEPVREPAVRPEQVPPPPQALLELSDEELHAEWTRLRERGFELVYERLPTAIEARFGALRNGPNCGLARLTPYLGAWTELGRGFSEGSAVSLLDGRHDSSGTHLGYEGDSPDYGWLKAGLSGGVWGAIVDLGAISLDDVTVVALPVLAGAAGELLATYRLPDVGARVLTRQEAWNVYLAPRAGFLERGKVCGIERDDVRARVGHSYAARIVCTDQVDLLAAVHVAALDDLGAIVAWRVLEARPLPVQR